MKVCVILVAFDPQYGFVDSIIKRLSDLQVQQLIVVNNGTSNITTQSYEDLKVKAINVGENLGSAGGFKMGILEACNTDSELFWLLDHDNLPERASLNRLKESWKVKVNLYPKEKLMLLSYRPSLMKHIYPFKSEGMIHFGLMRDSYLGFHIKKMWKILKNRVAKTSMKSIFLQKETATAIGSGYYGGLFFHKSCVSEEMLPDERFLTYWDDIDFTSRFRQTGGNIFMIPNSIINDLDDQSKSSFKYISLYHPGLDLKPTFKSFYYIRNIRILELRRGVKNPFIQSANKIVIISLLFVIALVGGNLSQFKLLLKSIKSAKRSYENVQ